MANIQERKDKNGKIISFSIRVFRGRGPDGKQLKPFTDTFRPKETWSETTKRKKAEEYAAIFEKECREGTRTDTRLTFAEYCEYVINLKEQRGLKHSTITRYRELTERIYPYMGHVKLRNLRPDMLNDFYTALSAPGVNKRGGSLSPKTILEYHRLISTVLENAVKECLVVHNVAKRATPPKAENKDVNYFQPETVYAISAALELEPIKWKTLMHLLLITGARRGELLGLKWENVLFEENKIYICNNILYSSSAGIYEDTPKTKKSKRFTALPAETMQLLYAYKMWQSSERLRLGSYYKDNGYLFTKDNGEPMHPDTVTNYCTKFAKKYNLPHINPHAFRHTMASMLYFNGQDNISISNRLGHAQPSTTSNIYAHVIEKADQKNAEILGEIFLKKA